ncbi:MAG: flagellar basal body P-ring formation protein FlgA [Pirellulaceae bacterium]|nr:flagellar basal body P-ring formation protein FlgA [Pirellulaceae bacterium]
MGWVFVSELAVADDLLHSAPAPVKALTGAKTSDALAVRFKTSPTTHSNVVKFGDLIEVISWGAKSREDLLEMVLAPAPNVGSGQDWTAADLRRHLGFRNVRPEQVRWSGPESVRIMRINAPAAVQATQPLQPRKAMPAFVPDRAIASAQASVIQATREYLWTMSGERTQWRIDVQIPAEHATALIQRRNIISIEGGEAPWTGPQTLLYVYRFQGQEVELELTPEIYLPTMVVVAGRSLRRDEVLDESALEYAALPERMLDQVGEYYLDIEEVVGKQLRRSLSTGLPVPRGAIGEPAVISSGELIEIESVAGAISVKTPGKALSGGAVGDLVNVELLSTRKRLQAIVVGPMQVRIAGAAQVSQPSLADDRQDPRTNIRNNTRIKPRTEFLNPSASGDRGRRMAATNPTNSSNTLDDGIRR